MVNVASDNTISHMEEGRNVSKRDLISTTAQKNTHDESVSLSFHKTHNQCSCVQLKTDIKLDREILARS